MDELGSHGRVIGRSAAVSGVAGVPASAWRGGSGSGPAARALKRP